MAAMDRISKLMPSSPSYLEEKSKIMGELPMAGLDKNVAAVFQVKDSIYQETKKTRDEAKRIDDELQKSKAATDYSVAAQAKARDDGNLLNDEREALKRVSAMPVEAREAFKSARAAGLDFWEAEAAANDVSASEVTFKDYDTALERVNDLGRMVKAYRVEKDKLATNLSADPATVERLTAEYDAEIATIQKEIRSKQLRLIDPYEKKKGGDTQERPEPSSSSTAPAGGTNANSGVNTTPSDTRPISETPTVPLSDAVKKNPNIKPGQFVTVPVIDKQGKVVATKTYLVTQ